MTGHRDPIPAPWVLIDDLTIDQTACLLERLTAWLDSTGPNTTAHCTRALTLGETDDPVTLASWADALAARLRHRAEQSQLDPNRLTP
jgi:hypothetical protein